MKKLALLFVVFALIAGACGGGDDSESADGASTADGNGSSDGGSESGGDGDGSGSGGSFCDLARQLDESDPFGETSFLGEDFFERAEDAFQVAIGAAPSEIKDDLRTMLDGLSDMGAILEKYDYDIMDPDLSDEMENFDTTEMDEAGDRIDAYLEDVCGISSDGAGSDDMGSDDESGDSSSDDDAATGGGDSVDIPGLGEVDLSELEPFLENPAALTALLGGLGLDAETAQCLAGEAQSFDFEDQDLESILDEEICGTTLMEIFSSITVPDPDQTPADG